MGEGANTRAIRVGDRASLSRTFGDAEIEAFAALTGDRNPLHLDDVFAGGTRFGRRIAHGMLSVALIGAVLGMHLPGPGAVYVSQTLRFVRPVYPQDTVTATVEVMAYQEDKRIATLRTVCTNQHGQVVVDGEAVALVESRQP